MVQLVLDFGHVMVEMTLVGQMVALTSPVVVELQ